MGLLIFGMAVVGGQVNSSLRVAEANDRMARAIMLVDTKYAELDAGVIRPEGIEDEIDGDFGIHYPGFLWRATFDSTETDDFLSVKLEIAYSPIAAAQQLDNPSEDIEWEDYPKNTLQTTYRLWPREQRVHLEDFVPIDLLDPKDPDPNNPGQESDGFADALNELLETFGMPPLPPDLDISAFKALVTDPSGFNPVELGDMLGEDSGPLIDVLTVLFGQGADYSALLRNISPAQLRGLASGIKKPKPRSDDNGQESKLQDRYGAEAIAAATKALRAELGEDAEITGDMLEQYFKDNGIEPLNSER